MAGENLKFELNLVDHFTSTMKKAGDSVNGMEAQMGKLNNTIANIGKTFIAAFTIDRVVSFGKSIVEAGAKVEDATTGLTTLLGDTAKATQVVKNTMEDATKTPFEFEGLLSANQQLIAAGVNSESARDDVMNLANAVAASGKGNVEFERMATNLAQIKTVGQATAMDIKQFGQAGINIYKVLADYTKKPIDQVKEMEVSYDMLTAALKNAHEKGGMYYGGLENMQKNTSVRISNLGDTIFQTMVMIYEKSKPLIDFVLTGVAKVLEGISNFIDNLDIAGFASNMIESIKNVIDFFRPLFEAFSRFFGAVIKNVQQASNEIRGLTANNSVIIGLRDIFISFIGVLEKLLAPIRRFFVSIFTGIQEIWNALSQFSAQGGAILSAIGDAIGFVVDLLGSMFSGLMHVIAVIIDVFHTVYVALEKLGVIYVLTKVFEGIWFAIKKIGEGIAWVYNHTIAPIIDAIGWAYSKVKDLMGIKDVTVTAQNKVKVTGEMPKKDEKAPEVTPTNLIQQGADKALQPPKGAEMAKGGSKGEASKVTGSKSVTINIQIGKLIEQFKVQTNNIGEGAGQIKEKVAQTLLGAINDSQIVAGI